jgi:hypothetical protein
VLGYHLVPASPQPSNFEIEVVVDARTAAQETLTPVFRNTCPHLVRNP